MAVGESNPAIAGAKPFNVGSIGALSGTEQSPAETSRKLALSRNDNYNSNAPAGNDLLSGIVKALQSAVQLAMKAMNPMQAALDLANQVTKTNRSRDV